MKIDYLAPVRLFSSDERNFVYVQILAEEPTGLYKYPEGWLEQYLHEQLEKNYGYYFSESYGLWKERLLTVEEVKDGATIVDGKPTRISGAEHRERFITPYNFIICGQDNVINNTQADINAEIILNDILLGKKQVTDFVHYIKTLPPSPLRQKAF